MKVFLPTVCALLLSSVFPVFAGERPICGGDSGLRGWGAWADAGSMRPVLGKVRDEAEKKFVLRGEFRSAGKFQGFSYSLGKRPEDGTCLLFDFRSVSGVPPQLIELVESEKGGASKRVFFARPSFPVSGKWEVVAVRFPGDLRFARGDAKDAPLRKDAVWIFRLMGHPGSAGVFQINNLRWSSTVPRDSEEDAAGPRNELAGDTSFETGTGWWMGRRGPAPVSLRNGDAAHGTRSLAVGREGALCKWKFGLLRPGRRYVLSFYAKSKNGDSVTAALLNLKWKRLAEKKAVLNEHWRRIVIPVAPSQISEDAYVAFYVSGTEVLVDAVQLEEGDKPSAYAPGEDFSLFATTGHAGEMIPSGESARLSVLLRNNLPGGSVPCFLRVKDPDGTVQTIPVELPAGKTVLKTIPLTRKSGFGTRLLSLNDSKGKELGSTVASYFFLPKIRKTEPGEGFFGAQDSPVPRDWLRRIGCSWLRADVVRWKALEPGEGTFRSLPRWTPAEYGNMAVQCSVGDLADAPGWAKLPGSSRADPSKIVPYINRVLDATSDVARNYDLQNEPDLTLPRMKGVSVEEAADYYAAMVRSVHPVIRARGKKLLTNISGSGGEFAERFFRSAGRDFDVYGPHPYTYPRVFGEGRLCVTADSENWMNKIQAPPALLRRFGGTRELAVGELGWALDGRTPLDSPHAVRQAVCLAQTFLLVRTVPEYRYLIWYSGMGWPENGNDEYALWRNENGLKPLPAAAAFAQCAAASDSGRLFRASLRGDYRLVRWTREDGDGLAIWNRSGNSRSLRLNLPPGVEARDLYGTLLPASFSVGEEPVYLKTAPGSGETLEAAVRKQIASAEPLKLQARPSAAERLQVTVASHLDTPWNGTFRIAGGKSCGLSLAPLEKRTFQLEEPRIKAGKIPRLTLEAVDSSNVVLHGSAGPFELNAVGYRNLPDWEKCDPAALKIFARMNRRSDVFPPDPSIDWRGPEDLSAVVRTAWDSRSFYLFVDVLDDETDNPFHGKDIWRGDSLQFAFDLGNDASPGTGYDTRNDWEFGVSSSGESFCWVSPEKAERFSPKCRTERIAGGVRYRVSIPWKKLGESSVSAGKIAGFSLVVHDRDNGVCNYRLCFGQGISDGKEPDRFQRLILEPNRRVRELPCIKVPNAPPCCALAVNQKHLFAVGDGTLVVYEIADPLNPREVGRLSGLGGGRQAVLSGSILYITARQFGVWIVDVSDPSRPKKIRRLDTVELATGAAVSGDLLFVTQRIYGVQLFDIKDRSNPKHLSLLRTDEAQSADCSGSLLAVGDWGTGKVVFADAGNPANPRKISSVSLNGFGDGVAISGSWCYASTGHHAKYGPVSERFGRGHGLEIFDLRDPRHPVRVSRIDFPPFFEGVSDFWSARVCGNTVFAADTHNGLFAVDVSDRRNPRLLGRMRLPDVVLRSGSKKLRAGDSAASVAVGDGAVYVAGRRTGLYLTPMPGLAKYEKPADSATPPAVAVPFPEFPGWTRIPTGGMVRRLAVSGDGNTVYAASSDAGLLEFENFGKRPTLRNRVSGICSYDVAVRGDFIYSAEGDRLAVYQGGLTNRIGEYRPSAGDSVQTIRLLENGDFLLWSGGRAKVKILSLADPRRPVPAGEHSMHQILYGDAFPEKPLSGIFPVTFHTGGTGWYSVNDGNFSVLAEDFSTKSPQTGGVTFFRGGYLLSGPGSRAFFFRPERFGKKGWKETLDWKKSNPLPDGLPSWDGKNTVCFVNRASGTVRTYDLTDVRRPRFLAKRSFRLENSTPGRAVFQNGRLMIPGGHAGIYWEND